MAVHHDNITAIIQFLGQILSVPQNTSSYPDLQADNPLQGILNVLSLLKPLPPVQPDASDNQPTASSAPETENPAYPEEDIESQLEQKILQQLRTINSEHKTSWILYGSHGFRANLLHTYGQAKDITPPDWDFQIVPDALASLLSALEVPHNVVEQIMDHKELAGSHTESFDYSMPGVLVYLELRAADESQRP